MTACGMKYNSLIDICKKNINEPLTDEDLAFYFFNFYGNADIDLICNHKSIYKFLDTVNKLIEDIKLLNGKPEIDQVHTASVLISDELILYEIIKLREVLENPNADINTVIQNFNNKNIKDYFYEKYYVPWKIEQKELILNKKNSKSYAYEEYIKLISKEEFRIYKLNYEIDELNNSIEDYEKSIYFNDIYPLENNNIKSNKLLLKLSENIRFKISSDICRTFEIFKSRNENFFSTISRFHMGFVRAFFNGKTVKCLPSYITSMMIQLSTDYKYFSSIRDPIEIVNKYRSRGFGIILNDQEKKHMILYNGIKQPNKENKWVDIYNIDIKNKIIIKNMFGAYNSNCRIFKLGKYFQGLSDDCFQVANHVTVSSFDDAFVEFKTSEFNNILKFKAINDNGCINTLDKYIINLGYLKINNINNSSNNLINYLALNNIINEYNNW
jgi:hypothetical protein